jgi:[ribosomal protein S5]-alanine N-acetyltransferase
MIDLIPIKQTAEENEEFFKNPDCQEYLQMNIDYYKVIGFNPPWICYYAAIDGELVGNAAYKGAPVNNKIEIAYGTFEKKRSQGIGSMICSKLVHVARQTNPDLIITARTLPEENHSTKILRKNGFRLIGSVIDKEDGEVWEWVCEERKMINGDRVDA